MRKDIFNLILIVVLLFFGATAYAVCGEDYCLYSDDRECTVYNTYDITDCCDGSTGSWFSQDNNLCCNGVYFTNESTFDDSSCLCFPTMNADTYTVDGTSTCSSQGDNECWDVNIGECCGDSLSEIWHYSTVQNLSHVLPTSTCYLGMWQMRENDPKNITVYNLWYD